MRCCIIHLIYYLIIILPFNSLAFKFTAETCREYGLGKNWYCEAEKVEADSGVMDITGEDILSSTLAPEDKAVALNELWEVQRKRAVITGEKHKIDQFLATHYLIADKGIGFAKNVQNLIETNPQLSSSESYYKNLADGEEKLETRKQLLQSNSNNYGIVFVYDSKCKYCTRQLPILLKFRVNYNFKIMGISSDGIYFSGINENITDINIAHDPLVKAFPTILLLDKKNPKKIFVAKGLTTLDELEEKIANRIKEREDEKRK